VQSWPKSQVAKLWWKVPDIKYEVKKSSIEKTVPKKKAHHDSSSTPPVV
jgi:hypothetical protein